MTHPNPTPHPAKDTEEEQWNVPLAEFLTRTTGMTAEVTYKITTSMRSIHGTATADIDADHQGQDMARLSALACRRLLDAARTAEAPTTQAAAPNTSQG